jgi:hypothetical protein
VSCANGCPAGSSCSGQACVCQDPTKTACPTGCVDLETALSDCGACGHRCEIGAACTAGKCACAGDLECPSPKPVCTQTTGPGDPRNCGTCGTECQDTELCLDGKCACKAPLVACSGTCVDTGSDPANCGGCGTVCDSGKACVAPQVGAPGKCQQPPANMTCPQGYTDCGGGSCVLTGAFAGDPAHCGACGTVCAPDEVCTTAGACAAYFASPSCKACPCGACGADHRCCTMGGVPLCVLGDTCGF